MSNVSFPVVTEYLEPNRPVTFIGLVFPGDTVSLSITLKTRNGQAVDLTGCTVFTAVTDKDKSTVWDAAVTDAEHGKVTSVVQPDTVGMNKVVCKVTTGNGDETTFFLGNLSVADDRRGTGIEATISNIADKMFVIKEPEAPDPEQPVPPVNADELVDTQLIYIPYNPNNTGLPFGAKSGLMWVFNTEDFIQQEMQLCTLGSNCSARCVRRKYKKKYATDAMVWPPSVFEWGNWRPVSGPVMSPETDLDEYVENGTYVFAPYSMPNADVITYDGTWSDRWVIGEDYLAPPDGSDWPSTIAGTSSYELRYGSLPNQAASDKPEYSHLPDRTYPDAETEGGEVEEIRPVKLEVWTSRHFGMRTSCTGTTYARYIETNIRQRLTVRHKWLDYDSDSDTYQVINDIPEEIYEREGCIIEGPAENAEDTSEYAIAPDPVRVFGEWRLVLLVAEPGYVAE